MFAKESASSSVQTLGPDDFPAKISKPDLPFFVDFFAPVCDDWFKNYVIFLVCLVSSAAEYTECNITISSFNWNGHPRRSYPQNQSCI